MELSGVQSERIAASKHSSVSPITVRKSSLACGEASLNEVAVPGFISSGVSAQVASVLTLRGSDAEKIAGITSISSAIKDQSDCRNSALDIRSDESNVSKSPRYSHTTVSHALRGSRSPTIASPHAVYLTHVKWTDPFLICQSSHHINGYQRSASLISNSQSIIPFLNRPVLKAAHMFQSRAYLHQYTRLGITESDFEESFLTLGQVIQNYQSLSSG